VLSFVRWLCGVRYPKAKLQGDCVLIQPNPFRIPPSEWVKVPPVDGPIWLRPVSVPTVPLWLAPGRPGNASNLDGSAYCSSWPVLIPSGGDWYAYQAGAAALDVVQLDAAGPAYGYDGYSTPTTTLAPVGIVSAVALAANVRRRYALLQNVGTDTVWLSFGTAAVVGTHVKLSPGSSYEMTCCNRYLGVLNAISSVAGQSLSVTEGV
jgi:hypothetical protein